MRRKGTQGSHLSVNTSPTMGSAQKANPIMSGAIIYVLVLIARRVIDLTRPASSCALAIVGKSTLSIDVLILVTMTFGNFFP